MVSNWHYTCNNKVFDVKYDAIVENYQTGSALRYNAPAVYESFPMYIDPPISWEQILKQRALEIRNSYNYIKLFYSGGCDSTKILNTFIKNNIYLDEIICLRCGIDTADYEIDQVAIPYLEKVKHLIPKTKISIVSPTIADYYSTYNDNHWFERQNTKEVSSINFRMNHYRCALKLQSFADNLGVNVFGNDKPYIIFVNNQWYTYFLDNNLDSWQHGDMTNVLFYSDCPLVHAKQCHMLKDFIVKNKSLHHYNYILKSKSHQREHNFASGRINNIDDYFIPKRNLSEKASNHFVSNHKEKVAIEQISKQHPDLLTLWQNSMNEFSNLAQGKWFNQGRPELGTVGVFTKFYCLNKQETKTVDELFPNGFYIP